MSSIEKSFWETRYRAGKTPWDLGGIPSALEAYLRGKTAGRALIPGCGSGYEVRAFHDRGWEVVALDYSPAAVERARHVLGKLADKVLLGDFFEADLGSLCFDLVYERTFLCSLPPELWPRYRDRMTKLIRDDGELAGLFFYGHEDEPPPYPISEAQAQGLFGTHFSLTTDEPVSDSLPIFAGAERWQIWRKKPASEIRSHA